MATNLIIVDAGGSPIVPDTSLSQPFSAFEFTPNCVPVMFESSRVANISPVLVTRNHPFASVIGQGWVYALE